MRTKFGYKDQQNQQSQYPQKSPPRPEQQPNDQENSQPPAGTSSPKSTPSQPAKVSIPTYNYYNILDMDVEENSTKDPTSNN